MLRRNHHHLDLVAAGPDLLNFVGDAAKRPGGSDTVYIADSEMNQVQICCCVENIFECLCARLFSALKIRRSR